MTSHVAHYPNQPASSEEMLDALQRDAFGYFLHETNPANGLVADKTQPNAPASIAAVGFALAAYPVGVERSWMTRAEAAERTLAVLRFFWNSPQGTAPDATGYKGFYYHFLDMKTGQCAGKCELSTVDTAFLLAGMLTAGIYFDQDSEDEREIRTLADALYRRADWQWAQNGAATITHGWKPESGFLKHRWEGYDEALLLYVLGLGSPTYPLPTEGYPACTSTYQWKEIYGHEFLFGSSLFIHQFHHGVAAGGICQRLAMRNARNMKMKTKTLNPERLRKIDAFWRAANYLSVGQIYLYDNPLLKEPLTLAHIKPRLLGHWGTTPGLNFIYAHLNRVIKEHDLNIIYITGPGHGGPGLVANAYLEGTYSEVDPNIAQDADGMQRLFKQFSFPGGIPSHVAPETPGSIHEGGELGYSLAHAFGAAFDNPDLLVACVVGDGEAETGPLATSWHSNKFLNPVHDGAVLPILHLNGYKIAGPTMLARIPHDELEALFRGYGYTPYFVEGDDPMKMHQLMAATLDVVTADIRRIQRDARANGFKKRPSWPMIILRSPKGWTGPKVVDGKTTEGTFRSHQVPMGDMSHPGHVKILEKWLKSYRPQELFDKTGKLRSELADLAPKGERRMSVNPHANGGLLLQDLRLPDFRDYAVKVKHPGGALGEATRVQGEFIRDVIKLNPANFRVFSPDETNSNRWGAVFEVTDRCSMADILPGDDHVAPNGRVMEILSEHQCEGWLEGYLLTGRHGFFSCYEAFIHIVDSMFNQHAKWLDVAGKIPWRRPIASLNYLLSSHVWRQDHNGFSHQDPGFIDVVANKKAEIVRVYLPPDANTLLSVTDHCLRSRNYVNVIVAGKQLTPQWLDMDAAIQHCTAGIGIWPWAGNDQGGAPDVVMACCGDAPTLETMAAVKLLRKHFPKLKVRVINVVDLMKLQPQSEHPHGLSDQDFDTLFTKDKPIIFAHHGYPMLIHRLTYRRTNHNNLHVRGFKEEGTTSTPFDMVVMNDLDRFHLVADVIDRVPSLGPRAAYVKQAVHDKLIEHKQYIAKHGEDLPEIRNWKWGARKGSVA